MGRRTIYLRRYVRSKLVVLCWHTFPNLLNENKFPCLQDKYLIFSLKFISGMNSIVLYLGHYVAWNTGPFNYISGNEAYILGHILYGPTMKNGRVKIDPFFLIWFP